MLTGYTVTQEVTPPQEVRNTIPAKYQTVTSRNKITEEDLVWREVLCDVNVTRDLVANLQEKLTDAGHYSNVIDGIWGSDTQRGVKSYAASKGLPSGNNYLPLETAESLGINL